MRGTKESMRKISRFYRNAIMQNLGLFIALGLLNVLFSRYGWFPNEKMQEITLVLYAVIMPVFIAYSCGKLSGEDTGAAVSVIAMLGVIVEKNTYSMFVAMLAGPLIGFAAGRLHGLFKEKIPAGFEMLVRNLFIGAAGVFFLFLTRTFAVTVISRMHGVIYAGADYLASHNRMSALCVIVEPLKVLFLNNSINHGILTPIGIEQMQKMGKSLFFLVEANPGPGLGILLARLYFHREEKKKYATYAFVQSVGGIHELYFPYVLARPALLLAAVAGAVSGMAVFEAADAGMAGPASPGSILLLLLLAAKGDWVWILLGAAVSAGVSFVVSCLILKWCKREKQKDKEKMMIEKKEKPKYICFACDAGFGSSAMAASLLRKRLKKEGIEGITVEHVSIDNIPEQAEIVFAQKSFETLITNRKEKTAYYFLESVMQDPVFETLIGQWKEL